MGFLLGFIGGLAAPSIQGNLTFTPTRRSRTKLYAVDAREALPYEGIASEISLSSQTDRPGVTSAVGRILWQHAPVGLRTETRVRFFKQIDVKYDTSAGQPTLIE